jgi:hypothetical protein
MGCGRVGLQALAQLHPIHAGHQEIEEDHMGLALVRQGEGRVGVSGRDLIVRVVQEAAEHLDDVGIMLHDQDQFPGHPSS